jgi:RHS repeat-associated protein
MLYSSRTYGTSPSLNDVGKLTSSTQNNPVSAAVDPEPGGELQPEGVVTVSHTYQYLDPQGGLSDRSTVVSTGDLSQSFSLGYGYDRWGNVESVDYPQLDNHNPGECGFISAPLVSYDWNSVALGAITLAGAAAPLLSATEYDGNTAMMTSWTTPVGAMDAPGTAYHAVAPDGTRGRPLQLYSGTFSGGANLFNTGEYAYDALGNITGMGADVFGYDALSRLRTAPGSAFTYDDFGNIATKNGQSLGASSATNRLTGAAYDPRGNVTAESLGAATRSLRWDSGNRLMAVGSTLFPDQAYSFAYDADGERVVKYHVSSGAAPTATFFLRDEAANVLTEFLWVAAPDSETGGWFRLNDHVYLGRNEVVRLENPEGGSSPWATTLVRDHLGSTRAEVDSSTSLTALKYSPFGALSWSSPSPPPLTNNGRYFTGHERDFVGAEPDILEGLDYMHARYYSPGPGRFLSVDPVQGTVGSSQSWNRYSYVNNNPLNFLDPLGMETFTDYDDEDDRWWLNWGRKLLDWLSKTDDHSTTDSSAYEESREEAVEDQTGIKPGDYETPIEKMARADETLRDLSGKGIEFGVETYLLGVIGKAGKAGLPIRGFHGSRGSDPYHALNRAIERGVSPQAMLNALKNPSVVVKQAGGRTLYLTRDAAVVLDESGQAVTVWGSAQHSGKTLDLLRAAGAIE